MKLGGSEIYSFSVLEYSFPLNYNEFIKHLEERDIKYKDKNNVLAFTVKKIMNGFVIHDENNIKYILIKFISLGWNDKNKLVEELDKNYKLISHELNTNTRTYKEYNIVFKYSYYQTLEAIFIPLSESEEVLRLKLSKKIESSSDGLYGLYFLDFAIQLILSLV